MYLENEIEPKISIVAEGHIDLMRKFQKIQVCNEEWEMMKMRVLALERGVREIKAKMDVAWNFKIISKSGWHFFETGIEYKQVQENITKY